MLSLDVEWLLGVCFAARTPADDKPEWPPQPDRVFSALAASWGARGTSLPERAALEWLEALDPPTLHVVSAGERVSVTAYVPPNDAGAGDVRALPSLRRRQPRRFPATPLPLGSNEPHLRLTWHADPAPEHLAALNSLAHDTSYLGHSSSLIRCIFHSGQPSSPALTEATTSAAPHQGRLRELESLYARHCATADNSARPRPAPLPQPIGAASRPIPESTFGARWIVLRYSEGPRPDLRGAAMIGRAMRDALMSAWPDPVPDWLSGHAADGTPSRDPHLAIIPLGNVGFQWSGTSRHSWHGLALVLPRAIERAWTTADTPDAFANRQKLRAVLRRLAPDPSNPDTLALGLPGLGRVSLSLAETPNDPNEPTSLRIRRYLRDSVIWSTATPIALDRHPKSADPRAELAEIIAASCTRIGLPSTAKVHVHKHAAISGTASAWPAGGSPPWNGWARPGPLAARPLTHATLRFPSPVRGPVILGAGRFFGLGLCLPVDQAAAE